MSGPRIPSGPLVPGRRSAVFRWAAAAALAAALLLVTGCQSMARPRWTVEPEANIPEGKQLAAALRTLEKQVSQEEARAKKLYARVSRFSPKGVYIVVDTGANRLYLMDGDQILREGICSTGSGSRLVDIAGKRVWVFNTPRGEFEVQRKIVNPVWTKPDWAFIEDGEPIPTRFADRLDPDVLGDYALALSDGYLIHGSIYKRTLGMSVTHGCVRLGNEDLEAVFKAAQVGTKVYMI